MTPETEFRTIMSSRYAAVHGICLGSHFHPYHIDYIENSKFTALITAERNTKIHLRLIVNPSCNEQVVKYTVYAVCDHLALTILKQNHDHTKIPV